VYDAPYASLCGTSQSHVMVILGRLRLMAAS
jgi:hypothetical protein